MNRIALLFLFLASCSVDHPIKKGVINEPNEKNVVVSEDSLTPKSNSFDADTTPVHHSQPVEEVKEPIITQSPIGEKVNDFSEIKYLNQDLIILKIEWRVETSVTVSGEGPHCDLIYWKHAYTPWKMTIEDSIPEQEVKIYDHFKEGWNLFPDVSMDELRQYVRGYCKESWYQHMKNAKTIDDKPLNIGISKLIFRINFKAMDDHKYYSKIYHQEIAMGC